MPEGPEVHTIVDQLKPVLTTKSLISIDWDTQSKYRDGLDQYEDLSLYLPMKIKDVIAYGKQIFITLYRSYQIEEKQYEKTFYLNVTLGMEGKFLWNKNNHSNLWLSLSTDDSTDMNNDFDIIDNILYFDDSRHFGNIFILDEIQYDIKIRTIGPDLLTSEITDDEWLTKAKNKRIVKKQICDYLMEQKYFSGIGNYLKAEILYAAKIRPNRQMGELTDQELLTLLYWSKNKIKESYQSNGLTIRSYLAPDGSTGSFVRVVYGKDYDPLGNPVIQDKFKDGRTTHWVPNIQV